MDRSRLIAPDQKRAFRDLLSAVNPLGASRGSMLLLYVSAFLTPLRGQIRRGYARELNINRFFNEPVHP